MGEKELEKFALYLKLDRGLSPKTVESYSSDLKLFFAATKPRSIMSLTRETVQAYLAKASQNLDSRSISRKLSALRLFFAFAIEQGWCELDATADFASPPAKRRLPKTLSGDEIDALLAAPAARGELGDAIMLRLLYASGLRVSELVSLVPEAVDTESGLVRVTGKGEKTRVVPIDAETGALIKRYVSEIRPGLRKKARSTGKAQALFLSKQGHAFTRQGFWKLIKKYALAAGIAPNVSPHVLRHAFATHLLESGMNLRSLQMLLGHSDISTTEIYSHVSTAHLRDALKKHHPKGRA